MTHAETPTKFPSRLLGIVLAGVAVLAFGLLVAVWIWKNPKKDTLWYGVAKTSLQVLGVVVIGGIVTAATYKFQQDRQNADKELERQREEFDRRAALLDRTSRCAQKMFVTCQHVRRVQKDHSSEDGLPTEARTLLDEVYREFNAEGEALQMELGARYGIRMTIGVKDVPGEAYLRWHQISDLLTVYYFSLCRNFRKDVLERNSKRDGELHSGIELKCMVRDPQDPTPDELKAIRDKIRHLFNQTMPVLVAPSTLRGRPLGPPIGAEAHLLDGEASERAAALLAVRHPILHGQLIPWYHRRRGWTTQQYRLTPPTAKE